MTTKEKARLRMAEWRAKNPERARANTRKALAKFRGKPRNEAAIAARVVTHTDIGTPAKLYDYAKWWGSQQHNPADAEKARRLEIIKQRFKQLKENQT